MVNVFVDHQALTSGIASAGDVCEIEGIGPVPAATAQALLSDSILKVVVTDGVDVRAVSKTTRTIPARVRITEPLDAPAATVEAPAPAGQPSPETIAMMQRLEARRRAAEQQQRQTQMSAAGQVLKTETVRRDADKIGRNDPCPCGSGKKYKKCHGA